MKHEQIEDAAQGSEVTQAWRVHAFGGPEVLTLETIARPEPGAGEVLIQVAAAGVGPWDGWIRAGQSALPQPLPLTLGSDLAGIVVATGDGVSGFAPGDRVFGVTNGRFTGAYAGHAIAEAGRLAHTPADLGDVEAASLPVVAVTAWQALFDHARLQKGDCVLIHGAGGSVGAYAVQFAHRAGLRVIATAAKVDRERLLDLGADQVLDYAGDAFEDRISSVDAVIDLVGGAVQHRSFAVLRTGGRLISAVSEPDQELAKRQGVTARFFLVEVTSAALEQIADLIAKEGVQTQVGLTLPFAEARQAHEILDGNRPRPKGKIVLALAS